MRTKFPLIKHTHSSLVQLAGRYLTKTKGCGFAFTELRASTTNGEIPDAIGFRSGMTILIECKATRSDFLSDKTKRFRRAPYLGMGSFRYYLCPIGIIQPQEVPEKWGLLVVDKSGKVRQISGPKGNIGYNNSEFLHTEKSEKSEMDLMYSALRRLHLRKVLHLIYEQPNSEIRSRILKGE